MNSELILKVADKMFRQYGYRRTTTEDIPKEAGIGKGSIYLHSASKELLGEAWIRAKNYSPRCVTRQSLQCLRIPSTAPADMRTAGSCEWLLAKLCSTQLSRPKRRD